MPVKPKTNSDFPDIASYLVSVSGNPNTRRELVARVSGKFREALSLVLSENQLIGIDYANTYGSLFAGKPTCASHDYCDPAPEMMTALVSALSERTAHRGGTKSQETPKSLFDLMATQDTVVGRAGAAVWRKAWELTVRNGFSKLWAVKERVPAEASFKVLASILIVEPERVNDGSSYPGLPFLAEDEGEIGAAAWRFVENAYPLSVPDAIEVSTVLHGLADNDDASGIVEYLDSFALDPVIPGPRR